jgi:hypothetical protein
MARKKTDPYLEQAGAQALVRFGPEMSALRQLLAQASQSYEDRVRQAKTGRQFTVGAVDAAGPAVQQAYAGAHQAVSPAFQSQGGVEHSALNARMAESQALAKSQLAARRTSAIEGEGAQMAQALRDRNREQSQIGGRGLDLVREMGAFTSATAGELAAGDAASQAEAAWRSAQLGQQERNSIRSAGFDPDTGLPLPGGKADPKKEKGEPWATPEAQGNAADEFDSLRGFAATLRGAGVSRRDAARALQSGRDESEVPVYRTVPNASGGTKQEKVLNADGTPKMKKVSGIPKAKSQLILTAALDQAYDEHLSRRTQRLLHQRRIKIKPLGATTFGEWLKTPAGRAWQRSQRSGGRSASGTPGISTIHGR